MSSELLPFQVDLRGVVDLLSRHIYSSPRVFLRELLQNGRDALTARAEFDGGDSARGIRITPLDAGDGEFVLRDDGIGLTASEMTELLSTVGRSSKRDIFDLPRSDYLGQFGIGLLSCFMVADRIVIRSRSARGGAAVEWVGLGDGTFSVREVTDELPIGTSVHLTPRFDQSDLLTTASVLSLATTFGEFLPVPVRVDLPGGGVEVITRDAPFLGGSPDDTLAYGRDLLGAEPFDAIEIDVPATGTRGYAYVLPFSPPPGARQASRVYLGRMLLGERIDDVLPEWAFFVRTVIDSTGLSPTASRESLVDDESLEYTRAEIGATLRRWVMELGLQAPHLLSQFVATHDIALKALVLHDDELARFITKWLSVETSAGRMTIDTLVRRFPEVRYAETVDEFRQLASFARSDRPIVNGGYVYDSEIARLLPTLFEGVTAQRVDVADELDRLAEPPLAERDAAVRLEDRATLALASVECRAVVRGYEPHDLPALYVADDAVFRRIDRSRARGASSGLWGGVLSQVDDFVNASRAAENRPDAVARLCLNWNTPVVRQLAAVDDDAVFARSVHLLYVQALLAGHRPLAVADRALMTTALGDLIQLSVGLTEPAPSPDTDRPA
ncbi:HSP90 family protein [Agromyces atrinae]|uniref:HSP90 family protein n=1 Tax=Agromyces atrinae TaxID=592376 RepID=A0A4Q2M738_9MICO|nr:HSP90 family protein [Agromyces atrinae]NYD68005.1 molecular chaperone HtpG [Agromyces atrinae]RXZ87839.1 HSP90 family protein [Agromyces atrinae]